MNGLPVWAKVVAAVGLPTVLALWLVGFLTGAHARQVNDTWGRTVDIQEKVHDIQKKEENIGDVMQMQMRVLVRICENTAKSEVERVACRRP